MKKIIVECLVSSIQTAILEDDKLTEILIEDNKNTKKVYIKKDELSLYFKNT